MPIALYSRRPRRQRQSHAHSVPCCAARQGTAHPGKHCHVPPRPGFPPSQISDLKSEISPGFTLAELLVASTLLTLLFVGAYTAFSSSLRLWRMGESNLMVYQDARLALSMVTRELENVLPGSAYLMEGADDDLEFYAIVPPMDLEEGEGPRPMWVRYRLRQGRLGEGATLVREERTVESPLPAKPPDKGKIDSTIIETGRKKSFDVASGVDSFRFDYYWAPEPEERKPGEKASPPEPVRFVVKDQHDQGWGLPQGIKATLVLADPNSDDGQSTFTTFIAFRGPTTPLATLKNTREDSPQ